MAQYRSMRMLIDFRLSVLGLRLVEWLVVCLYLSLTVVLRWVEVLDELAEEGATGYQG
jgi:hypothetical protein